MIEGSTEKEWMDIASALLSEESEISVTVYIDGASELDNSNAGIGGIFFNKAKSEKELCSFSENIGAATNNEAEYYALLKAVEIGRELDIKNLDIHSDSELIVKQINLEYKVKNERLQHLHAKARELLVGLDWSLRHVPRENNKKADTLSKQALAKR
ncbi:MAG: ribonuclease HI family protein [Candidatus Neomarinimicrobiota bacterium]|nr:ribonuclease HI family protein [Candidatus Neomarinimicrobiota bacterium]